VISPDNLRLYLVLDPAAIGDRHPVELTRSVIAAGVTCLQIRWKSATDREIVDLARALLTVTSSANVPLIVNDRLDLALASGANGVHLGVDDLPMEHARRLASNDFVVGYSPESDADLIRSNDLASYLGIGPFFSTATKADAGHALGAAEFARRRSLSTLPAVAIGGITVVNAHHAFAAGADGIAVVSAILGASDPVAATAELTRVAAEQAS
jgi:thiamine-phosphate diphosphorylase